MGKSVFLMFLFFGLIFGCNELSKKSRDNNNVFKLVYSHDINGELEPCG
ncbi:hypothetical protein IT568_12645 [bacterium]|nr:hypothetical protein [bacterium]